MDIYAERYILFPVASVHSKSHAFLVVDSDIIDLTCTASAITHIGYVMSSREGHMLVVVHVYDNYHMMYVEQS
jgi:hypothetical protein